MEKKKKIRLVVSIVLFIIMIIAAIFLYQNRADLLISTYKITYPDRCVETYKDDVLVSDECTLGRQIYEEKMNQSTKDILPSMGNLEWNLNLTI